MSIKVKAVERQLKFSKDPNAPAEYRYILQADLYSRLSEAKVIKEAALRSGINRGAINAAWDAIGLGSHPRTGQHAIRCAFNGSGRCEQGGRKSYHQPQSDFHSKYRDKEGTRQHLSKYHLL